MRKFKEIIDVTHHASDFGSGTIEVEIETAAGESVSLEIEIVNHYDNLEVRGTKIVGETECDPVEVDGLAVDAIEAGDLIAEYEQEVFKAQRERASEPDDGR